MSTVVEAAPDVDVAPDVGAGVMERATGMATERLEAEIKTLAGHLAAAMCRWLLLVAEFDRREGWASWECRSCSHWLSWQCSMSLRTAQEHLRVAHALANLPLVRARFSTGELSYSQVRAITRVADCPAAEEFLVNIARHATASALEKAVAGYRSTGRLDDQSAEDRHEKRSFEWWVDDDGMVCFRGRLEPEEARLVIAAIQAHTVPATRRSAAERPTDDHGEPLPQPGDDPRVARQADALTEVCRRVLTGATHHTGAANPGATDRTGAANPGATDRTGATDLAGASVADTASDAEPAAVVNAASGGGGGGGDAAVAGRDPSDDAPVVTRGGVSEPTATVVVLVDDDVLSGDADGTCRLDGGANLSPETARRLACDAATYTIAIGPDGTPRLVGKATKTVSRRLRRELGIRDDGQCQFPGCGLAGHLHAHHIIHREHHGPNTLENLLTLCSFHHRLVHEGGYHIELLMGQVIVHRPGRTDLAHTATRAIDGPELELRNIADGLDIDADTATSLWDGTRLTYDDLSWAIAALNHNRRLTSSPAEGEPDRLMAEAQASC